MAWCLGYAGLGCEGFVQNGDAFLQFSRRGRQRRQEADDVVASGCGEEASLAYGGDERGRLCVQGETGEVTHAAHAFYRGWIFLGKSVELGVPGVGASGDFVDEVFLGKNLLYSECGGAGERVTAKGCAV